MGALVPPLGALRIDFRVGKEGDSCAREKQLGRGVNTLLGTGEAAQKARSAFPFQTDILFLTCFLPVYAWMDWDP